MSRETESKKPPVEDELDKLFQRLLRNKYAGAGQQTEKSSTDVDSRGASQHQEQRESSVLAAKDSIDQLLNNQDNLSEPEETKKSYFGLGGSGGSGKYGRDELDRSHPEHGRSRRFSRRPEEVLTFGRK